MSLEILIFLGIAFNLLVFFLSRGFRHFTIGLDSLPAFSIIAGFQYGAAAGLWAGVIIAVAYHLVRFRTVHYTPLTVSTNVLVGIFAAYMGFLGLFGAGIILLVIYHVLSAVIVGILGGLKPGYFSFIVLNFITTTIILYLASVL